MLKNKNKKCLRFNWAVICVSNFFYVHENATPNDNAFEHVNMAEDKSNSKNDKGKNKKAKFGQHEENIKYGLLEMS